MRNVRGLTALLAALSSTMVCTTAHAEGTSTGCECRCWVSVAQFYPGSTNTTISAGDGYTDAKCVNQVARKYLPFDSEGKCPGYGTVKIDGCDTAYGKGSSRFVKAPAQPACANAPSTSSNVSAVTRTTFCEPTAVMPEQGVLNPNASFEDFLNTLSTTVDIPRTY